MSESPHLAARIREVADAVRAQADVAVPKQTITRLVWAVVVAVNTGPPSVDIAPGGVTDGTKWSSVDYQGWYSPTVGDNVLVMVDGTDRIVLGTMGVGGGVDGALPVDHNISFAVNTQATDGTRSSLCYTQGTITLSPTVPPGRFYGFLGDIGNMTSIPVLVDAGNAVMSFPGATWEGINATDAVFTADVLFQATNLAGTEIIITQTTGATTDSAPNQTLKLDFSTTTIDSSVGSDLSLAHVGDDSYDLSIVSAAGGIFVVNMYWYATFPS
jgi:hypothetical protein